MVSNTSNSNNISKVDYPLKKFYEK